MFYKRTLVLSDINNANSSKKGVITFENLPNGIRGQLRLYNFDKKPSNVAIGISCGGQVVKVPISFVDNTVNFEMEKDINLQEKLSCGLVDLSEITHPQIIIGGTSNYLNDWADKVEQAFSGGNTLEKESIYESSQDEIEQEIATVLRQDAEYKDCSMCANCKYKQAFFDSEKENEKIEPSSNIQKIEEILSTASLQEVEITSDNEKSENKKIEEKQSEAMPIKDEKHKDDLIENPALENSNETEFYDQIEDQINDLFKAHIREENLESIIPNSKWVKVEYEDTEGHYVMGLIYNNDVVQFISYGLPAPNSSVPPKDLEDYAQWLPTTNSVDGQGYWLVYQSAKTGESVKAK